MQRSRPCPADQQASVTKEIADARGKSNQKALANMTVFPMIMLFGYIILVVYFKSRGGYQQVHLSSHADEAIAHGQKGPDEY